MLDNRTTRKEMVLFPIIELSSKDITQTLNTETISGSILASIPVFQSLKFQYLIVSVKDLNKYRSALFLSDHSHPDLLNT